MRTVGLSTTRVDDPTATDLAGLVAHPHHPRPFLLDEDNAHAGYLPDLAAARAIGRPYVVTVADDVLAFDLDDRTTAGAADALAAELAAESWPVLRVQSGRDGHRHLWIVAPDPLDRDALTARATARGLPAPRKTMRPPGAPHRLGLPVVILDDPAEFSRAVARARAAHAERAALDPPERLDWRHLLASGRFPAGWSGDGSPSSMVWHVCIGADRAGLGLDDVRRLLANPAHRGGHAYRARLTCRGTSHADHWLDHYVWPSATEAATRRPVPPADAEAARERLLDFAAAVAAYRWKGQAGATDRAVLVAILTRAQKRGSLSPVMSYREIAEAAPCHVGTVARSVARLVAAGWLQMAERGRGRTYTEAGEHHERADATRWRLLTPRDCPRDMHTLSEVRAGGVPPVFASRAALDAFRWRGLGLNAPRVLDALADGPLNAAELADRLSLNRGNLRVRLLPSLAAHGLIVRAGDRWRVVDDLAAALELAAEALGLTGKADAVAAQHAAERAGYLAHRERTRPDREARRRRLVADATAARRAADAGAAQLWPEQPAEAPVTAEDARAAAGLPPPPPTPTEAHTAPLVLAGGRGHDR